MRQVISTSEKLILEGELDPSVVLKRQGNQPEALREEINR